MPQFDNSLFAKLVSTKFLETVQLSTGLVKDPNSEVDLPQPQKVQIDLILHRVKVTDDGT